MQRDRSIPYSCDNDPEQITTKGLNIILLSLMGVYIQFLGQFKNNLTQHMMMLNSISSACIAGPACPPPLYVNTTISMGQC